jgi:Rps23 Pro-64 3,4-dihydroxylase Tpa1-like proline 4-hydroxylase
MIIKSLKKPFPHLIVDEVFTNTELKTIWHEVVFLQNKLRQPDETYAAHKTLKNSIDFENSINFGTFGFESQREYLKNANGIFLDSLYDRHTASDILQITRKFFNDEIKDACKNTDLILQQLSNTNFDSTLLNYYGDGEYYHAHKDGCIITIICVLHKTPKSYEGGELYFKEYDYSVNLKNNQSIYFPSLLYHEVKEVKLKNKKGFNGRFAITKFVNIK